MLNFSESDAREAPCPDGLLVRLRAVDVAYGAQEPVLCGLNLDVTAGLHLTLLGPNGGGKSTLLRLLHGDIRPRQLPGGASSGSLLWCFGGRADPSPLRAKERSRLVSPLEQRRYVRQGWNISGEEILLSGLGNTAMVYGETSAAHYAKAQELAAKAGAEGLLGLKAPAMSQGQMRLALILRALISRPELLLLDEPFDGLDRDARRAVFGALELAVQQGCTLLVSAHRTEDAPPFIRQSLLVKAGRISPLDAPAREFFAAPQETLPEERPGNGPSQTASATAPAPKNTPPETASTAPVFPRSALPEAAPSPAAASQNASPENAAGAGHEGADAAMPGAAGIRKVADTTKAADVPNAAGMPITADLSDFARELLNGPEPLLELRSVDVFLDRHKVLHDVDWTVHRGEQWLLSGGNGAGKSTLLRLLYGEEFAAFGGLVSWRGGPRPGLEELRTGVGYVSDRLQDSYAYDLSAEEVVISGLRGSVGLYHEPDEDERALARDWLGRFGLTPLAGAAFHSLSSGNARRVLLARALAASPPVLLLDEPCTGLDAHSRRLFLQSLAALAAQGRTLFYVSHHQDDAGPLFTHELRLERGRVVSSGKRE